MQKNISIVFYLFLLLFGLGDIIMPDGFENTLALRITVTDKKKILDMFELCKSFQLPVLDGETLIGLVDIFTIVNLDTVKVDLREILITDFYVAGKDPGIFTFKMTTQSILPFVDEDDKYVGFSNMVTIKCYVPGSDYFRMIESSLPDEADVAGIDEYKSSFDAIIEDNYEGIYVTIDKGKTIALNQKARYLSNINNQDVLEHEDGFRPVNTLENEHLESPSTIAQTMQKRKEISFLRLTSDMFDLPKMQQEINNVQNLADKYKAQLDTLKSEQEFSSTFVSNSPSMKKIMKLISHISQIDSTILLQGDSGVGKGLLARTIHEQSLRKDNAFMTIDCATLPPQLLESELFGYESGAFTGAEKGGKIGLVEMANNGTLFLDEIGELPFELQAKLLRMLQDRTIYRVGGNKPIKIDARVISATNRNLEEMVKQKLFRSDLYYRLRVVPIEIPPLIERQEDIKPLIDYFMQVFNEKYNLDKTLSTSALKKLLDYNWPGNVREIENTLEYLMVTTNSDIITPEDLVDTGLFDSDIEDKFNVSYSGVSLKTAKERFEKELLNLLVTQTSSTLEMAEMLEIDRSTVTRKLIKYGIKTNFKDE